MARSDLRKKVLARDGMVAKLGQSGCGGICDTNFDVVTQGAYQRGYCWRMKISLPAVG
jgi:hypothetical protein